MSRYLEIFCKKVWIFPTFDDKLITRPNTNIGDTRGKIAILLAINSCMLISLMLVIHCN